MRDQSVYTWSEWQGIKELGPSRNFAPSDVLNFIQELFDASRDRLLFLLDNIDKWEFGKTDLLLWANLLDKFDDIFEQVISSSWNTQSGIQEKSLEADELKLILAILKFIRLLLENSSSRNLFSSYDKLKKFLTSNNLFVIVATLELLILPAYKLEIHNALRTTFDKEIGTPELAAFARIETTSDLSIYYQNLKRNGEWEEYKDLIGYSENLALGIFMMATSEQQLEIILFSLRPTIVPDTAKLVLEALKRKSHLDTASLIVLRGISKVSLKWTDLVHTLQLTSATGPIISSLHELFQSLHQDQNSVDLFFLSAFVELFVCLASCGDCDEALIQAGVIGEILHIITINQDLFSKYFEKMLYALDLLISHVSTAIDQFFSLHGLNVLIRELEVLVSRLSEPLSINRINQDIFLVAILKFLSKLLRKYNGDDRLRNLIEGSLFTTIRNIFSQIGTQSHEAIAYSITIVSVFIHSEPSALTILQEIKLPQVLLESITQYLPPNEHVILQLPQCIEAFCLNSTGLELFQSLDPFGSLLKAVFLDRRMMNVLSANGALNLGDSMDEFVRHYPQFREYIIGKCIEILNLFTSQIEGAKMAAISLFTLASMPTFTPASTSIPKQSSLESSPLPNMLLFQKVDLNSLNDGIPLISSSLASNGINKPQHDHGHLRDSYARFCEVLESFFRTETTIQAFILANGVPSLISSIDGVTLTFGKTNESTSISSLLLRVGQSNHLALGSAFIDSLKPLILSKELALVIQHDEESSPPDSSSLSPLSSFSSFFLEVVNDESLGQGIYNQLSRFSALASLLVDILRSVSSVHDRILSSFIMIFLNDDGKAMIIFLTLLLRSCIWHYYQIYHKLPQSWRDSLSSKYHLIFNQNPNSNSNSNQQQRQSSSTIIMEPDPTDPTVRYVMNVLFLCQQIASTGISLFGCLSRLIHDPRCLLGDSEKDQALSLVSNALLHCINWLRERQVSFVWMDYFSVIQSFAFEIFFEDKNDNICWTRLLLRPIEAFDQINGFDDYLFCITKLVENLPLLLSLSSSSQSINSSVNMTMEKIFTLLGRFFTVNSYKSKQVEELISGKKTFLANVIQFVSMICYSILTDKNNSIARLNTKSRRIFLTTLTGLLPYPNNQIYSECAIMPLIRAMMTFKLEIESESETKTEDNGGNSNITINNSWSEFIKPEDYSTFNSCLQYFFEPSTMYKVIFDNLPLDLYYEGALLLARTRNVADCIKHVMRRADKYLIIGYLLSSFRMVEFIHPLLFHYYKDIESDFLNLNLNFDSKEKEGKGEMDESSLSRLILIITRLHSVQWWWKKGNIRKNLMEKEGKEKEKEKEETKESMTIDDDKKNATTINLTPSLEFKDRIFNQIMSRYSSTEIVHSLFCLLHVLTRRPEDFSSQEIKSICSFVINHSIDFLKSSDPRHRTIIHLACIILRNLIDTKEYLAAIMENHLFQLSDNGDQISFYLDQISSVGNDAFGMRNWPLFVETVKKSFVLKDDTLVSHALNVIRERKMINNKNQQQQQQQQQDQKEKEDQQQQESKNNNKEKEEREKEEKEEEKVFSDPRNVLNTLEKSPLAIIVMETLLESMLNLKTFPIIDSSDSIGNFLRSNRAYQDEYHTRCAILFLMNELVASYPVCHQAMTKSKKFKEFLSLCYDKLVPMSGGDFLHEKTDYLSVALFVDRLLTQICVGSVESDSKDLYSSMMDSCRIMIEGLGEVLRQNLVSTLNTTNTVTNITASMPLSSPFSSPSIVANNTNTNNNNGGNSNITIIGSVDQDNKNYYSKLSKIWSLNITITSLLNMKVESHRMNSISGATSSLFTTSQRFASHVRKTIAALMLEQRFVPILSDQLAFVNGVHTAKGANIIASRIMINLETLCKFGSQLKSVPGNTAIADLPSVRQVTRGELSEDVEGLSSHNHHIDDHMIVDEEEEDLNDDEYDTENDEDEDEMDDDQIEILSDDEDDLSTSTMSESDDDEDDDQDVDVDEDVEMMDTTDDDEDDEEEAYSEDMYDTEDDDHGDHHHHSESEESVQLIIRPPDRDTSTDRPVNITVDIRVSTEPNAIGFDGTVDDTTASGVTSQIIRYNNNGINGGASSGRGGGGSRGRQRATSFRIPSSMIIDTSRGEINIHDIQAITNDLVNYQQEVSEEAARGGEIAEGTDDNEEDIAVRDEDDEGNYSVMEDLFDDGDNDYDDYEEEEDEDILPTTTTIVPNAWNISGNASGYAHGIGSFDPRNRIFRSRQRNIPRINYPFTFMMIETAIPGVVTSSTPGAVGLGAHPLGIESYVQIIRPGDVVQHPFVQRPTTTPATLSWSRNIDLSVYADWLGELKVIPLPTSSNYADATIAAIATTSPSSPLHFEGNNNTIANAALISNEQERIRNIEVLRNISVMTTTKRYQQSQQLICGELAKEFNRGWIEMTKFALKDATKALDEKYPPPVAKSSIRDDSTNSNDLKDDMTDDKKPSLGNGQGQEQETATSHSQNIDEDEEVSNEDEEEENEESTVNNNQPLQEGERSGEREQQQQQQQQQQSPPEENTTSSVWVDHGPDTEFLIAMPYSLRAEVLQQHFRERRQLVSPENATIEIDPEFLRRLPEDLRNDYIRYSESEIRRHSRRLGFHGGGGIIDGDLGASNQLITELLESFDNGGGDFSMAIDDEFDDEDNDGEGRAHVITAEGIISRNNNPASLATRIANELAIALQQHQQQANNAAINTSLNTAGTTNGNRSDRRHHIGAAASRGGITTNTAGNSGNGPVTNQILRAITSTFDQLRQGRSIDSGGVIISTTGTTGAGSGLGRRDIQTVSLFTRGNSININDAEGRITSGTIGSIGLGPRLGMAAEGSNGGERGTIENFIKIKNFEPLADSNTLCNILLGFFDMVLGDKKSHCKVLLYLSENPKIRQDLLNVLILILEEKPWTFGDLASLLQDYLKSSTLSSTASTSTATAATAPSVSSSSSVITLRNSSNVNSSRPSTPGGNSSNSRKRNSMEGMDGCIVILQRCLQLLFYLVTRNNQVRTYFTSPCSKPWTIRRVTTIATQSQSQSQKRERGEEVLTTQFPIVLLFAALDNSLILQTSILSEQLLHLLASISGPIKDLVERKKNGSDSNLLLPEIPNHFLHLLVKALVQVDLTPIAFGHAMNAFQNICSLGGEQFETILKELFGSANKILIEKANSNNNLHFLKLVRLLKIANSILIRTKRPDGVATFTVISGGNGTTTTTTTTTTTSTTTTTTTTNTAPVTNNGPETSSGPGAAATTTSTTTTNPAVIATAAPSNTGDELVLWQPDVLVDHHAFIDSHLEQLVDSLSKPIWNEVFDRIHEQLSCIPEDKNVDHPKIVNEYLAIIEAFFLRVRILSALLLYNDQKGSNKQQQQNKEQGKEEEEESKEMTDERIKSRNQNLILAEQIENNLMQFSEKHRRIINAIIRQDPSILLTGSLSLLIRHTRLLDFDNKRVLFKKILHRRNAMSMNTTSSYGTTLTIRRQYLFEESFAQVMSKRSEEFKHGRLHVKFIGEEGVDAGGLTREWFSSLAKQMFNADYALFKPASIDKITYQPNRASWVNPEHLRYFEFVGRIIGKAIYDGRLLDCHFTRSFYKHILGKPVTFKDLEGEDPEFFKSLQWILDNNIEDVFVGQTFTIDTEEFGQLRTIQLCPNGSDQLVTELNKKDYVQLVTEFKLYGEVAPQIDAFLIGFYSIVPSSLISIFDEGELELLLSGIPDIDIDDWRNHTDYHGYSSSSPQIQWFWRAVRSFDTEQRCRLLQFVTGTSKVPLEGFGALPGSNSNNSRSSARFSIHKSYAGSSSTMIGGSSSGIGGGGAMATTTAGATTTATTNGEGGIWRGRLPTSHTCFNQLDLPEYDNYDELRRMLLKAIEEGAEGFGFA